MRTIKKLDLFLLKTFLPLFIMTFGICLFIFLMQFLWKYIDEMVGKGIEIHVLAECFFYAALTFVPQSLPLAILFASLMTFGNLGEQLELLSMKASGISLMRIMLPLIVFLAFVAISAFFFQNNIIPKSQVKFLTMMYSIRTKSPELEIPESTFYTGISGKNLYVRKKDNKRKLFKDVMIYDYADGFNNLHVIVADSGRLRTSTDKKFLVMTLYSGELFANQKGSKTQAREARDAVPYRRETFDTMEMLIEFDGNFNMRDESMYSGRFVGKNISELHRSIDSLTVRLDSIKRSESMMLYNQSSYRKTLPKSENMPQNDSLKLKAEVREKALNFDSLLNATEPGIKSSLLNYSKDKIEAMQINYGFKAETLKFEQKDMRWHHTEMHRKFTLSFACLIFFFIGAPLGAIIRKGGLGTPAVISVLLFIFYYIIDNIGYKMARDGVWLPWEGMWLSSAILLPLGIFLTYKAVNDSVILNSETYLDAVKRFLGKRQLRKIERKELVMEKPDYSLILQNLNNLKEKSLKYTSKHKRWPNYPDFWKQGGIDYEAKAISADMEAIVAKLENSDKILVLNKTMDFPVIENYRPVNFTVTPKIGTALAVIFPVGGIIYLISVYRRKLLLQDMHTLAKVCDEIKETIGDVQK
ncbi:MAG: LptF/LptG family permease [Tannerella sp.]|jgi:lipopolysaccharide export system permease protein|nr:LptF/LptG family permease [Tannerella sp.]